ncbi:MAG TPA: Gfo/Idh/MocA family oxidoreductase [Armatimonadota bacterium]|nr:Gfo/Idh/MocA family oxidoreductase [Armatimonadota bacterium]
MGKKLKIGVIGLGSEQRGMGQRHVDGFRAHPQASVVALCDTNEEQLHRHAAHFAIDRVYTDAADMFEHEDLDAVSIATPNAFHAPLAIAALQHGLHVFCEKPMSITVSESEAMLAAARASGKNLMIDFIYRFSPMSYALKSQVDAGIIGDIYFGRTVWHRRRRFPGFGGWFGQSALSGGGPLIDLGVHRLDLALWLMGYPEPVSVSGSTFDHLARVEAAKHQKPFDVEDLACGMVKFANGATLIVEASWATYTHNSEEDHMETKLYGTKGGLLQANVGGVKEFIAEIYTAEGDQLFTKRLDKTMVDVPSPYIEFINSILESREPMATAEQGVKVMKILEGIYRSAETGQEIRYEQTPALG